MTAQTFEEPYSIATLVQLNIRHDLDEGPDYIIYARGPREQSGAYFHDRQVRRSHWLGVLDGEIEKELVDNGHRRPVLEDMWNNIFTSETKSYLITTVSKRIELHDENPDWWPPYIYEIHLGNAWQLYLPAVYLKVLGLGK